MKIFSLGFLDLLRAFNHKVKVLVSPDDFRMSLWERKRLEYSPRYHHTRSLLLKRSIELNDPFWYLFSYREIFLEQNYRFIAKTESPLIIDCGANIGMSVIYFKYLYPNAKVIAFEPDEKIFRLLERNMDAFRLSNVTLCPQAVWSSKTEVSFLPEGSVGGTIVADGSAAFNAVKVQAVRLRDFLNQKVDLLKVDIEGAEYEVIKDCCNELGNIDHLFVEYHGKANERQILHEILQIIQDSGFRYHIKDANPIQHPFVSQERHTDYDLQLNIFGFRD